ncbi:MAG: 1-acyl-sn-glycerol-3-phosphate acyltransferase [Bacteroidota bacterium]
MFRFISRKILTILGWKLEGMDRLFVPKCIIAVAPHTSQWDVVLLIFIRAAIGLRSNFIVKKEAFFFPLSIILKWLRAEKVDRNGNKKTVDVATEAFQRNEEFRITLAPEGTRKFTNQFKTGFYYIALKTNIPIMLLALDYSRKLAKVTEPFYPSGDVETDLKLIHNYFKEFQGLHPEKALK